MTHVAPVELRFTITPQEVIDMRANYLMGIAMRAQWERDNAGSDVDSQRELNSLLDYLNSPRIVGKGRDGSNVDAVTLGYVKGRSLDFPTLFLDKRVDGARMNAYALPKTLAFCRILNGASFRDDSDDNTNCATIIALAAKMTGGKLTWQHINETCSAFGMGGGNYGSGATQGGSSLRALAALGIVEKQGNAHIVCDAEMFGIIVKAARKRLKK